MTLHKKSHKTVTTENHSNVRRKFDFKKAVDDGEFDTLLEEQLAYGSHLKKYL